MLNWAYSVKNITFWVYKSKNLTIKIFHWFTVHWFWRENIYRYRCAQIQKEKCIKWHKLKSFKNLFQSVLYLFTSFWSLLIPKLLSCTNECHGISIATRMILCVIEISKISPFQHISTRVIRKLFSRGWYIIY